MYRDNNDSIIAFVREAEVATNATDFPMKELAGDHKAFNGLVRGVNSWFPFHSDKELKS